MGRKGKPETKLATRDNATPRLYGRRTFRPESIPGFPEKYAADPSRQTAARMYADELSFRRRLCGILEQSLERLVSEVQSGLTMPSTSAALGRAIADTVERIEKMATRIGDLEAGDQAGRTEVLLARLNRVTSQLRELRSERRRIGPPRGEPVPFEDVNPNGEPPGTGPGTTEGHDTPRASGRTHPAGEVSS